MVAEFVKKVKKENSLDQLYIYLLNTYLLLALYSPKHVILSAQ